MKVLVVLTILLASSDGCDLPEELVGQWDSSDGWNNLDINSSSINSIPTDKNPFIFSCFMNNGTTYLLRSPLQSVGELLYYYYYTCMDIVAAGNNPDLVFFRMRTVDSPTHENKPFKTFRIDQNVTMAQVCDKPASDMPMNYTFFLRKGYEANVGNESCPRGLQAVFSANFTTASQHVQQCPDGFELNGCDRSHLTFNYTICNGGAPNYTCLTSVVKDDVTYTIIKLQQEADQPPEPNHYELACLSQQMGATQGTVMMTKSSGMCGAAPSVDLTAEETLSCRSQETPATTQEAPGSSGNSSQTPPFPSSTTQAPGTGDGGQGGGGSGDGNSCGATTWGVLSLLLPVLGAVLADVKL